MKKLAGMLVLLAIVSPVFGNVLDTGVLVEDYSDGALSRMAQRYRQPGYYGETGKTVWINTKTNRIVN